MENLTSAQAFEHLSARLDAMSGKDTRHTPHWNDRDQQAVWMLLEKPASRAEIALARIEGITFGEGTLYTVATTHIHRICRRALELPGTAA